MPAIPPLIEGASPIVSALPIRKHKFEIPKLRLQLNDLAHEGSSIFLSNVKGGEDFETQVQNVLNLLYTPDSLRPGTRSVTLILRAMGGVAYTTGMDLDNDHKEIHFNMNYISQSRTNQRHELLGVMCHELVHCFQWAAGGTCDGGLIEGIADWVRLRAGLAAAHWKQEAEGEWNRGYQHTGFFLEYLEQRFGPGTVRSINSCLREGKYDEEKLFTRCCDGHKVRDLWEAYRKHLKDKSPKDESKMVKSGACNNHEEDSEK